MALAGYAQPLAGGALIGLSAALLLYTHGRLAGISGVVGGTLYPSARKPDFAWRVAFLVGLLASGRRGKRGH